MLISTENIQYSHPGQAPLSFPDIHLKANEALLVLGKSGSGKTTLLNILGGLLKPHSGSVSIDGVALSSLEGSNLDLFRGKNIGIVFQKPHLLAPLTVEENLQMAHYFSKKKGQEINRLLDELGIGEKSKSRVQNLSEGEAQRVSIARALVNSPKLILADEPTSSLDDENTFKVLNLLQTQAKKIGAALIIVTHDQRVKDHIPQFIEVKGA
ncbi:putative ABC transport system ATP-binding protein [Algoriphagus ornithinivorans]|uniref:Putative ABC transport system ATP-binding protein n=1 Tax=Algoriphagus ornithinivorans TaxID=226506 RepID=A0A1I5IMF7_9BACT|nr:ATP-binding cassette domain-containing protein [Algoriphagus ornithinivorans]SFO61808.1 putative ABC transport system ATP-binding protein [Algoriphagus ornithinivorans]